MYFTNLLHSESQMLLPFSFKDNLAMFQNNKYQSAVGAATITGRQFSNR